MKTQQDEGTMLSILPTTIVTITIDQEKYIEPLVAGKTPQQIRTFIGFDGAIRNYQAIKEKTFILLHDLKRDPFKKMESLLSRYVKSYCDDKTATFEFKEIKPGYPILLDDRVSCPKGQMEIQTTVVVNYQYEGPPENISIESSLYKNNLAWIGKKLDELWGGNDPEPEILSIKKGLTLLYLRD